MSAVEEIEAAIAKLTELRPLAGITYLETVNENHSWHTTQLAFALNRTIDAQLAILAYAASCVRSWGRVPYTVEVDLARAINGTA